MVEVYGKESPVPEYGMVFLIIKYFIKITSFFNFIFLIAREYRFYLSIISYQQVGIFRSVRFFPCLQTISAVLLIMLISDFRQHGRIPTLQA